MWQSMKFGRMMGRNGGGGIQRDGNHHDMEVGKWGSLSRKVEGATRSLALAAAQWLQLPLGLEEACSAQAPGLPSLVPTLNNYNLGLVATVIFIAALSPATPSPTGRVYVEAAPLVPHTFLAVGSFLNLEAWYQTAFLPWRYPSASEADLNGAV